MKRILIVGGSSGIGSEIINLNKDSAEIINLSRTQPAKMSANITHHSVDVLTQTLPDIEPIDSLIYCPGSINLKPITSLKEEDFLSDFNINVMGAVRVIQKYLKVLKKSENASILLFGTVAVEQGMPFHSSIAVAKAGVQALTRTLAAELAPAVRVNCIAPTITNTPLASGILRNEKSRANIEANHPLKRIPEPRNIASMASYLISEQAKFITGQVIGVDSGLSKLKA